MTRRQLLASLGRHDGINFALTNRIPRRWFTQLAGRISKSENPVVRDVSLALWRLFTDIDLKDAKTRDFKSLHDCFTRELKDGARPLDEDSDVLISPCDGIVVAAGTIEGNDLLQVKGSRYALDDLLASSRTAAAFRNGHYVTLRLTSAMYHRFHAPAACRASAVRYIPGDVWNVNPPALHRIPRLYCRNERAVIELDLSSGNRVLLVPVAAILVAGLKLRFLSFDRSAEPRDYACAADFAKGDEMGWFEHGSTIIVISTADFSLDASVQEGRLMRMGQALMRKAR